jgi:glycosyltransferase involved in cell wall biosynthesis
LRRLLYLVHGMPPEEYSGTPLVTQGYARHVSGLGWEPNVIYGSTSVSSWDEVRPVRLDDENFVRVPVPRTAFPSWAIQAPSSHPSPDDDSLTGFKRLLEDLQPDLLHVVDNVNLPLEWPELASASGVPVVRTVSCLEDLCALTAPVCPTSAPRGYCQAPLTLEHCARCVTERLPVTWGDLARGSDQLSDALLDDRKGRLLHLLQRKRIRANHQFSDVFDRIVFSNHFLREYFEETLPLLAEKVRVVPMGMELEAWKREERFDSPEGSEPLVLCLAGLFDPAKGHSMVSHAFTQPALLDRSDYRLLLLGLGDSAHAADLVSANPNVSIVPSYSQAELPDLLRDVDVGLSTSWFETFHRVTREYLLAGLPVIANPTFGVRDVVVNGENGLLYDPGDSQGLCRAVIRLIEDRDLLERLTAGARATPIRSVQEELADLVAIYDELTLVDVEESSAVSSIAGSRRAHA